MKVAFRFDDITTHMNWDMFDRLVELFSKYQIKPLLGVIPDNRDPTLLKLPYREDGWAKIKALKDRGWLMAQHGYQHAYVSDNAGLLGINHYSEFAGVAYQTQFDMLRDGRKLLEEHGLASDIFMAPAHSYDDQTLQALSALGFRYVTDGYSLLPYKRHGLKIIPCQTSVPRKIPFGLLTICLHPNTMTDEAFITLYKWLEHNRECVCDYEAALKTPGLGLLSRAMERCVLTLRKSLKNKERPISDDSAAESNAQEPAIVLFTANYAGGILQFAVYLAQVLARQGQRVCLFLPENAGDIALPPAVTVYRFKRYRKAMPGNKYAADLARRLAGLKPARVLLCDDTIITEQILLRLEKKIQTTQFIHDVLPHPSWTGIYERLRMQLERTYRRKGLGRADQIRMLSKNGYEQFLAAYPKYRTKADYMLLGAHIPDTRPVPPAEMTQSSGYYLFFGRIDKYKGVVNLLKAYERLAERDRPPLVIAGSGTLQAEEANLAAQNEDVVLINRFVDDAEMLWLIQNALTVALPYIEASQSGVLPLAYHFGVPVVTSAVRGLAEFVEDGESGYVCADIGTMSHALGRMNDPSVREKLSRGALRLSKERLDWDRNVKKALGLTDIP